MIITIMTVIAWQAGTPDPEDETTRPLMPVATIALLVVVTFVILGRVNAPVAHAEAATGDSGFTVIETGAEMGVDLPPATATAQMAATLAAGQRHYAKNCAGCHGPLAQGLTGLGSALPSSELVQHSSSETFVKVVREGLAADNPINQIGIPMPPNGGNPALTDEELMAILHYLRSL